MGGNTMSINKAVGDSEQQENVFIKNEERSMNKSMTLKPPVTTDDSVLNRLSEADRGIFQFTPTLAGLGSGLVGLLTNSYYRRALHITKARIASSLPMFIIPCLSVTSIWMSLVTQDILTYNLNCDWCIPIRGAAIGVVFGTLYPVILAIPINMSLAERYKSVQLPKFNQIPRYWWNVTMPVKQRLLAVAAYQAVIYGFFAYNQYSLFLKAHHLKPATIEPSSPAEEELVERY